MIISRRALSCWARYRETEPAARAEIVAWAGLSVADIYVLEQLEVNRREAGDEADWFQSINSHDHYLRSVVAPALLARLVLRTEDAKRMAKALCLRTPGRTCLMEQALEEFLLGQAQHRCEVPARMTQTPHVVVQAPPPPERLPRVYDRILEALDAFRVNIARPLEPYVREAIADRAGTTPNNVVTYMSRIRKERGCLLRIRGGTP